MIKKVEIVQHPLLGEVPTLFAQQIQIGEILPNDYGYDYDGSQEYFHEKGLYYNLDELYFTLGEFESIILNQCNMSNYTCEEDLVDVPLSEITIINCQLSDQGLKCIFNSINKEYLLILNLSNNQITNEQLIEEIIQKLSENTTLILIGNPVVQKFNAGKPFCRRKTRQIINETVRMINLNIKVLSL